ncbi:hypothetical protein [Coxiella-like endosymbiont of Rhipicephalus sanguineus]|uniref:hypothetical protein n=1 Tax=Coxiella-like endosymbiont of Rhipicephalus sanguineus TaxID=1955402 RepID=UPI00203AC29B|nr:hypothetical protein [Coxiella-like endosymbiont of Rhipicephalus sanguineus]
MCPTLQCLMSLISIKALGELTQRLPTFIQLKILLRLSLLTVGNQSRLVLQPNRLSSISISLQFRKNIDLGYFY